MSEKNSNYYLVREEILPEAIKKTIKVKELLKKGEVRTINEAVEKLNLSRSAYYKYKDYVFPFYEASKEKIVSKESWACIRNAPLKAPRMPPKRPIPNIQATPVARPWVG